MENEIEKVGSGFFEDITKLLVVARASAYRTVNSIMVETYWKIGRRIVEEEQMGETRAVYGERLIENLSRYLAGKFGSGFSVANLKNIRKFYLVCPELDRHCLSNLSWSNICAIMRISNSDERNFYFEEAATEN